VKEDIVMKHEKYEIVYHYWETFDYKYKERKHEVLSSYRNYTKAY